MIKTYKHKKLWWIAEEQEWDKWCRYVVRWTDNDFYVRVELFVDSSDWEEIKQEDWYKLAWNELNWIDPMPVYIWRFRQIIEKYMPKVSENEIDSCFVSLTFLYDVIQSKENIIAILKEKWLLSDK